MYIVVFFCSCHLFVLNRRRSESRRREIRRNSRRDHRREGGCRGEASPRINAVASCSE